MKQLLPFFSQVCAVKALRSVMSIDLSDGTIRYCSAWDRVHIKWEGNIIQKYRNFKTIKFW